MGLLCKTRNPGSIMGPGFSFFVRGRLFMFGENYFLLGEDYLLFVEDDLFYP